MKKLILAALVLLPTLVAAQEQKYGDWEVVAVGELRIAKVFNAAKNTAGVLCSTSTKACTPYVTFGLSCDEGSKYPILLNSAVGSVSTYAVCAIIDKVPYMFLEDMAGATTAFESGGEVGFVTPAQGGAFQVVRFSSTGATVAMRLAREAAMAGPSAKPSSRPASQQL